MPIKKNMLNAVNNLNNYVGMFPHAHHMIFGMLISMRPFVAMAGGKSWRSTACG